MKILRQFLYALLVTVVIPIAILSSVTSAPVVREYYHDALPEEAEAEPVQLPVRIRSEAGETELGDMDTYLIGVLLGEMPGEFAPDALTAQAVAARTFAWKAWVTGGKHGDGSVCKSPGCCQAYLSPKLYLERGGREEVIEKMRTAVLASSGYVLTYEGQLIEATYFSSSGGYTEDAAAVWGGEFPYLVSVKSPEEDRNPQELFFSYENLKQLLGITRTELGEITRTRGQGVESLTVGNKRFSGTELRALLHLPSTWFEAEEGETGITFRTYGFGHRVGMSQYGADAMAEGGSTWQEILAYYYPGTELCLLKAVPTGE